MLRGYAMCHWFVKLSTEYKMPGEVEIFAPFSASYMRI